MVSLTLLIAAFGFGLVSMSVIAIAAVGFTMQFGITNMINLAYGQVMIASAYVAYYIDQAGVSIWIAMLAGAAFGAVFSFLLNRFIYAPFQRKGTSLLGMVIVSLAVSLMISNIMLPLVGYFSVSYRERFSSLLRFGSIALTVNQIAIIFLAVAVMLGVHAVLRYTRLGKAMRATAANPTLARSSGIPTQRVIDLVWLITGALCGLAGVVAALDSDSFTIASGAGFLITALAAAVVGGAGQPYGAMIGAVVIGLLTELSAAVWSPDYKQVVAFAILVLVMVLRPQGLLARRGALAAAG
jgi:branched-subunit amino acid ABC-type transport system permease component